MKYQDESRYLNRPLNWMRHNRGDYDYITGSVATLNGIVNVYSQGDKKDFHMTRLDVAKNGRIYSRRFDKRFTQRGLVTKACQFAKEIAEKY